MGNKMSCRKFEAPRHGSLAYMPKVRSKSIRCSQPASPKDNAADRPHLTSFLSYKVGMTHILRISSRKTCLDKRTKEVRKEIVDAVTLLECPEMKIIGARVYKKGINGFTLLHDVLRRKVDATVLKRNVNRFYSKKEVVLSKVGEISEEEDLNRCLNQLSNIKESEGTFLVKIVAHTQIDALKLDCKKAHIAEIQVNGGSLSDQINYCADLLRKGTVNVRDVYTQNELISIKGVTKGKGFTGTVKRYGVTIQPRKSNKGIRKVACIGAWHPAGVLRTVARCGQMGYFTRTMTNKKIVKIGHANENLNLEYDLTEKTINPVSGFLKYGDIKSDYIMVKGPVVGPQKRVITLGKSFHKTKKEKNLEEIDIKFVDTSSKLGHGRFQTRGEKVEFFSR